MNSSRHYPNLTPEELEALENLDKSIRIHENDSGDPAAAAGDRDEDTSVDLTDDEDNTITVSVPQCFHPFKLPAIPETREAENSAEEENNSTDQKINSGYILFDGAEIKYVSNKTGAIDSVRGTSTVSSDKGSSIRSRASTGTHTSEIPVNFYLSADELLGNDYLSRNKQFSITPFNRLPTNSHFSLREKLYFLLIGLACVISFCSIYINVTFFQPYFGQYVLSLLGACHHASVLVAMTIVFMGKKTWFPFVPTVILSFLLMAGVVAVFPILQALSISYPVYIVYALIVLNGLCTGFGLAVTDRMVLLFPGGKSKLLFRWGSGIGSILPAIAHLISVVLDFKAEESSRFKERITLNVYIVFSVAFVGIFLGFLSVLLLSRRGIYKLFTSKENTRNNSKCMTMLSSPTIRNDRCGKISTLLLAQFLVPAVTWYCLSMIPMVHSKTLGHNASNKAPFWKYHFTTVLVGLYQLENFLGLIVGTISGCCCRSLSKVAQNVMYFLMSFLCLGFVAAIVFYIRGPFLVYYNIFILALYFLLAMTNGALLVGMATSSQSISGLPKRDLCPIISQITWLSIQMGSVVGVVLSFVHLT